LFLPFLEAEDANLIIFNREQDKEATVYIGNIDERVTDSLIWELMLQAGRIVNVHLPKDRVTQTHQGYGFVEFISEEDAEYAARIMNQVRLYGKPIRVNKVRLSPLPRLLFWLPRLSIHIWIDTDCCGLGISRQAEDGRGRRRALHRQPGPPGR
jgi:splicing factor 3B subunit 4